MVGRLLQNSTMYICMQQGILIRLQHRIFSFNDYIHSTSTNILFIQQYFVYSTNIFVQEEYLFNFNSQSYVLWNEYIYSTSKHIHSTLRKFPDIDNFLFNKAPPIYPPGLIKGEAIG